MRAAWSWLFWLSAMEAAKKGNPSRSMLLSAPLRCFPLDCAQGLAALDRKEFIFIDF